MGQGEVQGERAKVGRGRGDLFRDSRVGAEEEGSETRTPILERVGECHCPGVPNSILVQRQVSKLCVGSQLRGNEQGCIVA